MYRLRELERKDISTINKWRNNEDIISNLGAPFRYINQDIDRTTISDFDALSDVVVKNAIRLAEVLM